MRDADRQLERVAFHCQHCGWRWRAVPDLIADDAENEHHPWAYFADCSVCAAERVPQAAWERNLLKAWANATGPKTAEGKAAAAANLAGHPTPEEARRTRFNALKTGIYARTATYFPARPGRYPQCDGCEYRENVCAEQVACLKRTELFMRHHLAFEAGDPTMLSGYRAESQAAIQALVQDMILTIAQDGGPRIVEPVWYHDKEGAFHLAGWEDEHGEFRQITELKAHPLLKPLIDFISRNAMTLADSGMTPREHDDQELVRGHLNDEAADRAEALEWQRQQASALQDLRGMIERSQARVKQDPVLLEHERGQDGDA